MTSRKIIRLRHGAIFDDEIQLHLFDRLGEGRIAIAEPLHMRVLDQSEHGIETPPVFSLDRDTAQSLMDELWHLGIRPTEGHGSTGQLAAVERHLNHTTAMLDKTLQTALNVVNASILQGAGLSPVPTASKESAIS